MGQQGRWIPLFRPGTHADPSIQISGNPDPKVLNSSAFRSRWVGVMNVHMINTRMISFSNFTFALSFFDAETQAQYQALPGLVYWYCRDRCYHCLDGLRRSLFLRSRCWRRHTLTARRCPVCISAEPERLVSNSKEIPVIAELCWRLDVGIREFENTLTGKEGCLRRG